MLVFEAICSCSLPDEYKNQHKLEDWFRIIDFEIELFKTLWELTIKLIRQLLKKTLISYRHSSTVFQKLVD